MSMKTLFKKLGYFLAHVMASVFGAVGGATFGLLITLYLWGFQRCSLIVFDNVVLTGLGLMFFFGVWGFFQPVRFFAFHFVLGDFIDEPCHYLLRPIGYLFGNAIKNDDDPTRTTIYYVMSLLYLFSVGQLLLGIVCENAFSLFSSLLLNICFCLYAFTHRLDKKEKGEEWLRVALRVRAFER